MRAKPYQVLRDELFTPERQRANEARGHRIALHATLQNVRKALGLTQEQVAEALKVSQAQISKYETSDDMMLSGLRELLAAMGCEVRVQARHGRGSTWVDIVLDGEEKKEEVPA